MGKEDPPAKFAPKLSGSLAWSDRHLMHLQELASKKEGEGEAPPSAILEGGVHEAHGCVQELKSREGEA